MSAMEADSIDQDVEIKTDDENKRPSTKKQRLIATNPAPNQNPNNSITNNNVNLAIPPNNNNTANNNNNDKPNKPKKKPKKPKLTAAEKEKQKLEKKLLKEEQKRLKQEQAKQAKLQTQETIYKLKKDYDKQLGSLQNSLDILQQMYKLELHNITQLKQQINELTIKTETLETENNSLITKNKQQTETIVTQHCTISTLNDTINELEKTQRALKRRNKEMKSSHERVVSRLEKDITDLNEVLYQKQRKSEYCELMKYGTKIGLILNMFRELFNEFDKSYSSDNAYDSLLIGHMCVSVYMNKFNVDYKVSDDNVDKYGVSDRSAAAVGGARAYDVFLQFYEKLHVFFALKMINNDINSVDSDCSDSRDSNNIDIIELNSYLNFQYFDIIGKSNFKQYFMQKRDRLKLQKAQKAQRWGFGRVNARYRNSSAYTRSRLPRKRIYDEKEQIFMQNNCNFIKYDLKIEDSLGRCEIGGASRRHLLILNCDYKVIIGLIKSYVNNINENISCGVLCDDIINLIFYEYLNNIVLVECSFSESHDNSYDPYEHCCDHVNSTQISMMFFNHLTIDYRYQYEDTIDILNSSDIDGNKKQKKQIEKKLRAFNWKISDSSYENSWNGSSKHSSNPKQFSDELDRICKELYVKHGQISKLMELYNLYM